MLHTLWFSFSSCYLRQWWYDWQKGMLNVFHIVNGANVSSSIVHNEDTIARLQALWGWLWPGMLQSPCAVHSHKTHTCMVQYSGAAQVLHSPRAKCHLCPSIMLLYCNTDHRIVCGLIIKISVYICISYLVYTNENLRQNYKYTFDTHDVYNLTV